MKKILKVIGFGILTWLIPLIIAIPFYSPSGEILIDQNLFKSIMIVVGSLTGAVLLVIYFKNITKNYLKESLIVGLVWLVINYLLDFLILLPMSRLGIIDYLFQIGIRYLNIPISSVMVGLILKQKLEKSS